MFPVWIWTIDPSLRTICSSYSYDLSLILSVKSRDVLKTDKYRKLFPEVMVREDLDAKGHFGTNHGGERYATSTNGTITGFHGHFLIIDDPINPKQANAVTTTALKECRDWFDTSFSTRKVDKRVSVMITVMQRLHESDLTAHELEKLDKEKVKHICIPCDDSWEIKPERLRKYYVDGLMDPVRMPRDVLKENESLLGPLDYAGQFGQSPRRCEGNLFLEDKYQIVDHVPEKIIRKVRYWDKAGTEGGTGAATAGVKIGQTELGRFVVLDCKSGRWAANKREAIIKATAEADGLDTTIVVEQEPGSGGLESADHTMANLAGYVRFKDKVTGDKELRANPWSIEWNNGKVLLLKGDWNKDFIQEHLFFPRGSTIDKVDAASGSYAWLTRKKKHGGAFFVH
jgi:predicted phage terminase large subunit-like protein